MKLRDRLLQKLTPHMCLAEWGRADMETILGDSVLCAEKNIPAISALPGALRVLNNAASGAKVYCFIDDAGKLPELAGRKNTAVQLFLENYQAGDAEIPPELEIIPAFALSRIEYFDWTKIILSGKKLGGFGFMFIDDNGEYIHRFYNFLDIIGDAFNGAVHYCAGTNDMDKLDDAYRLVEKVRPKLIPNLRFFVSGEFFRNLDFQYKSV